MTEFKPADRATQEVWTTLKVLSWTTTYLHEKGVENARREAEWLLCEVTGLDRMGLYLHFDKPLQEDELAAYRSLVLRRGRREPLQHIIGSQEFDGLEFIVSKDVLIPRYDTETLIEEVVRRFPSPRTILDIGTGSGCIAIALARRLPEASITAVDISSEALVIARQNALRHGVTIEFLQGSYFEAVGTRRFDLIVSNPPYITTAELVDLQPEVRDFEPRLALDGGLDGLTAYRQIVSLASAHLVPSGYLVVEVGAGQAPEVSELFVEAGFNTIVNTPDSAGIQRVVGGVV